MTTMSGSSLQETLRIVRLSSESTILACPIRFRLLPRPARAPRRWPRLVGRDPALLDHLAPARDLAFLEGGKSLRRASDRLEADLGEPLLGVRAAQRRDHLLVDAAEERR